MASAAGMLPNYICPRDYDFVPLLDAFKKYLDFAEHHKYRNNYDYQLAILLLNNKYYMTNGAVLLVENQAFFSAISQLHYGYYTAACGNWPGFAKQS